MTSGPRSWCLATLLGGCLVGATAPAARAWNNAGHAQIAEVAWARLDDEARRAVVRALERHPRFAEDFAARMPEALAEGAGREHWIFLQASLWPDLARQFAEADDPVLRALHRGAWHYINLPLTLSEDVPTPRDIQQSLAECREREELNLVQALKLSLCKLQSPATAPAERALYLSWLFHLVGDLHQPLHAVALFTETTFRDGDRGGNSIRPGGVESLHALWDDLPGLGQGVLEDASLVAAGERAARDRSLDVWLGESRELARLYAYSDEVRAAVRAGEDVVPARKVVVLQALDETYMRRAAAVARQRIVEAGFRLAVILQELPR